ncbi:MAG: hypothetical protein ACOYM9_21650, partial [Bradymonadia bacterium]
MKRALWSSLLVSSLVVPSAVEAARRPARLGALAERIAVEAETNGDRRANALSGRLGNGVRRRGGQDLVPVLVEPMAGVATDALDEDFIRRLGGQIDARSRRLARVLLPATSIR